MSRDFSFPEIVRNLRFGESLLLVVILGVPVFEHRVGLIETFPAIPVLEYSCPHPYLYPKTCNVKKGQFRVSLDAQRYRVLTKKAQVVVLRLKACLQVDGFVAGVMIDAR